LDLMAATDLYLPSTTVVGEDAVGAVAKLKEQYAGDVLIGGSATIEKHANSIFAKLQLSEAPVHRRVAAVHAFLDGAVGSAS
jgi:hypothetical protein